MQFMEAEITLFLQAEPYQRTGDRTGYRNGYKPRIVKTRVGRIELSVPQDREGRFCFLYPEQIRQWRRYGRG